MIAFERPLVLLLAVPWIAFVWIFFRFQRRALAWVRDHVSERFRRRFTVYTDRSMIAHMILISVMGLSLAGAAARPFLPGAEVAGEDPGRLLILIDASASMRAEDVAGLRPETGAKITRFDLAREIAIGLGKRLEGYRIALATFSGVATTHLPLTDDRPMLDQALEHLTPHTLYRSTGSSFSTALDVAPHFFDERHPNLQVVLLSDGEQPTAENFGEPLAALAGRRVPIHTVAVGSPAGMMVTVFDPRDLLAGKTPPSALKVFKTRRVDRHLKKMADESGGSFHLAESGVAGVAEALHREIEARRGRVLPATNEEAGREVSVFPLFLFLFLFLFDTMVFGHHGERPGFELDVERIAGKTTAFLALCLFSIGLLGSWSCGENPLERAHRQNELGILRDLTGQRDAARRHYERSIAIGARSEIPTFNLGRSVTATGDFSEAHRLFQRALELAPDLAEAHYNDGIALYRWGVEERDPRDCELARTLELWEMAGKRFASTLTLAEKADSLSRQAEANRRVLSRRLAELEALIAEPPEHCRTQQSPPSGAGSEGDEPPPPGGGSGQGGGEEPPPAGDGSDASGTGGQDGGGTGPLTVPEREQIRQALERIREQAGEEGKFYRRTGAEQVPKEERENPDPELWW